MWGGGLNKFLPLKGGGGGFIREGIYLMGVGGGVLNRGFTVITVWLILIILGNLP